jgi:hypothetical protein
MERLHKEGKETTTKQLSTFASQIVARAQLMARLGMQYGGSRDIYKALGYDLNLQFDDFLGRYTRQEIAKAIIDRPVKATWQGPLELVESEKSEDTEFEKAWENLNRKIGIKTRLTRIDKLTGIGRYGVLFLGLDDINTSEDFEKPTNNKTARKLLYLNPFSERSAQITTFVTDPKNPRYGLPLLYTIETGDMTSGMTSQTRFIKVHYSRVIHITDGSLESEVYGTPVLEPVYNRLMDLEKIVGGDAEMFWRSARPGFEGKVDPDFQMTPEMEESLKDQFDEYENDLRRFLINEGVDIKALVQQIADPTSHVDAQLQMISAETGIPKRVLTGSERGELASTQDSNEWKDYVQARREDHAEPNIVRPFVDRLIELKILPKPSEDYTVKWNDLYSLSEKARVEIGKGRANALREYTYNPIAQEIIPPKLFYEKFLGFTKEDITLTEAMRDTMISEEELNQAIIDSVNKPPTPAFGGTTPTPAFDGTATTPVIPKGKPVPKKKTVIAK